MTVTRQDIEQDIECFDQRIEAIKQKLSKLPARGETGQETRKINDTRRKLFKELGHFKRIREYAVEGLSE